MLRFAPSPTGNLHIGNARIAVLNFLYAKNKEIDFFLRIDDTDSQRSDEKYVESIIDDLSWLGINFSKVTRQSDRLHVYNDVFNELKKNLSINSTFNGISFSVDMTQSNPDVARLLTLRSFGESLYHSITDSSLEFDYENK